MTSPSDIVQRLRTTHFIDGYEVGTTKQHAEAADEIEKLRGLLREAIKGPQWVNGLLQSTLTRDWYVEAKAALEGIQ